MFYQWNYRFDQTYIRYKCLAKKSENLGNINNQYMFSILFSSYELGLHNIKEICDDLLNNTICDTIMLSVC